MKFFIDTANIDQIREAYAWGIIDGVTTNPSLITKEGRDFVETIFEICELVDGPVSAEVVAKSADDMVRQGELLAQVHKNVVVKVPLTEAGITATSRLSRQGIRVNVTLCFSATQALLAAKAGATYVSPFVGRVDDLGTDGMELITDIVELFANFPDLQTEVLAASIRHPLHVAQAAQAGAHVATIPHNVLKRLFQHPLTEKGDAAFMADWKAAGDLNVADAVTAWLKKRG